MVFFYVIAGIYVLIMHFEKIPEMLALIVRSAFVPTEAAGAFVGGTVASAFLFGMKRAVFSNEAGQGSSAIAHSAVKTNEPVREGLVAGLEPFIDTIVVCTFTALIILSTGIWNRAADASFAELPQVTKSAGGWSFSSTRIQGDEWRDQEPVLLIVTADPNRSTGGNRHRIAGTVRSIDDVFEITWADYTGTTRPAFTSKGFYKDHVGATLTAKAFDSVAPGLGKWLITIASWLFAISTIIAWGYYGEQGVIYIAGKKGLLPFNIVYCALTFVATLGHIKTSADLDNLTGIGLGVIIYTNLPILWIFGYQAMRAYRNYVARLKSGQLDTDDPPPTLDELLGEPRS